MDLTNPARSLCAPVPADVLVVLERTHRPLTGLAVARLAGRSYAQVSKVLHRLVDAGLVDASPAGQATLYTLNRDHILAPAVTIVSSAHRTLSGRMAELVAAWPRPPLTLALFGSAARRDGTASSDVDLLLLRPDDVPAEDEDWQVRRHGLAASVDRWSGNTTQVVEMSQGEILAAADRDDPLVASLLEESRLVWGTPMREVMGRRAVQTPD